LDKFYSCRPISDRKDAEILSEEIRRGLHASYCAALLSSFLAAHMGHNCTVFNDNNEQISEELDPDFGANTKADGSFWRKKE
jgi:hypothetical protein